MNRTRALSTLAVAAVAGITVLGATAGAQNEPATVKVASLTQILGRPTNRSISLNVLSPQTIDAYVEYGATAGRLTSKTKPVRVDAARPNVIELTGLGANRKYYYRLRTRPPAGSSFATGPTYSFMTQRAAGASFTFALQGDSHPERVNKMYDPKLYQSTLARVAKEQPDFYVTMGDDFSLDRLIERDTLNATTVDQVYVDQRALLGTVGAATPLFLVNGNHEQAARTHLDGTPSNPAVLAGQARNRYFALPAPDAFYTGDTEEVPFVGLPRDYYAWTWGDALFVVLDPYWHSPVPVDVTTGDDDRSQKRQRDWWGMTIGDAQYQWLKHTLETSTAKYKFVFEHHVMGTGRGGIEEAQLYEFGGKSPNGTDEFAAHRPGWELPIHQLMAKNGVTIYFQGHDHLYAHQELDGVTYQSTPNPADPTETAFNREAYESGTILPNSGHLLVSVAPSAVTVRYVASTLSQTTAGLRDGQVADTYTVASSR